jgi:hypothetical protein
MSSPPRRTTPSPLATGTTSPTTGNRSNKIFQIQGDGDSPLSSPAFSPTSPLRHDFTAEDLERFHLNDTRKRDPQLAASSLDSSGHQEPTQSSRHINDGNGGATIARIGRPRGPSSIGRSPLSPTAVMKPQMLLGTSIPDSSGKTNSASPVDSSTGMTSSPDSPTDKRSSFAQASGSSKNLKHKGKEPPLTTTSTITATSNADSYATAKTMSTYGSKSSSSTSAPFCVPGRECYRGANHGRITSEMDEMVSLIDGSSSTTTTSYPPALVAATIQSAQQPLSMAWNTARGVYDRVQDKLQSALSRFSLLRRPADDGASSSHPKHDMEYYQNLLENANNFDQWHEAAVNLDR